MAMTSHQTTPRTQTSLKCWWHGKQKWEVEILHRLKCPNGTKYNDITILLIRPRRAQSDPRISLVCSDPTKNRLEEGMDWPLPTSHSTQSTKHAKSNLCSQNKKHSPTYLKREIFPVQSHGPPWATRGCRPNEGAWGIPPPCQSVQWTKIPTSTKENCVGPCNWTTAKCPEITSRKAAKTSSRWNSGDRQVYGGTPTIRNHQARKRTIRGQLFLRKEGRRETTTSTRLLTTEQIYEEKPKHIPTNSPSNWQTSRMHPVYKI